MKLRRKKLLNQDAPENRLSFMDYDNYWKILREHPSFRAIQEFKAVIDCSQVLESRIEQAFTQPVYNPMALRIIHAFSVYRVTTKDIYASLLATSKKLYNLLCLCQPEIGDLGEDSVGVFFSKTELAA